LRKQTAPTYLYRSRDYGASFERLVNNLPSVPVNVILEDPLAPNSLYVGTDLGAYISVDRWLHWQVLGGNLPTAPVTDIPIHPRDQMIVISTLGRGAWALDALGIRPAPPMVR
jgi:hypothetical protein